jgi:hypothetical protein
MCDVTDTSNRKGMKVYRAPEFLYSHMIWVPQRDGSKNLKTYFVYMSWNSILHPSQGLRCYIFFKNSKSLSTTGQTLWHLYILSPVIVEILLNEWIYFLALFWKSFLSILPGSWMHQDWVYLSSEQGVSNELDFKIVILASFEPNLNFIWQFLWEIWHFLT